MSAAGAAVDDLSTEDFGARARCEGPCGGRHVHASIPRCNCADRDGVIVRGTRGDGSRTAQSDCGGRPAAMARGARGAALS